MNDVGGYYSCSINPSYISTWYTSFKKKTKYPDLFSGCDSNSQDCDLFGNAPASIVKKKPENFKDNFHHGRISAIAQRKIEKAIDYTIYLAQPKRLPASVHGRDLSFRLNFITLTLSSPQIHPDSVIKSKIFQPMLNSFRKKWNVVNYVWRAEKQANDNIHFHIVTDRFIPWNELRNTWNKHQQNLGYITRYRERMIDFHKNGFQFRADLSTQWSREKQFEAYLKGKKNEWNNPNSSDVHSLKNISNVRKYFVKYMTKSDQSDDDQVLIPGQHSHLSGRLWGCSERLSQIRGARADLDNSLTEELLRLTQDRKVRTINSDFFSVSFISMDYLISMGFTLIVELFEQFIGSTFPEYRPNHLFNTV